MCGTLQLSLTEKMQLHAGMIMDRHLFDPKPHYSLRLSSHRFVRIERLDWWELNSELGETYLKVPGFYEKNNYFAIPENYSIRCVIHKNIEDRSRWVISILTIPTKGTFQADMKIQELRRKIAPIHDRMPFLKDTG